MNTIDTEEAIERTKWHYGYLMQRILPQSQGLFDFIFPRLAAWSYMLRADYEFFAPELEAFIDECITIWSTGKPPLVDLIGEEQYDELTGLLPEMREGYCKGGYSPEFEVYVSAVIALELTARLYVLMGRDADIPDVIAGWRKAYKRKPKRCVANYEELTRPLCATVSPYFQLDIRNVLLGDNHCLLMVNAKTLVQRTIHSDYEPNSEAEIDTDGDSPEVIAETQYQRMLSATERGIIKLVDMLEDV